MVQGVEVGTALPGIDRHVQPFLFVTISIQYWHNGDGPLMFFSCHADRNL